MADDQRHDDCAGKTQEDHAPTVESDSWLKLAAHQELPESDVVPVDDATATAPSFPARAAKPTRKPERKPSPVPVLGVGEQVDDFEIQSVLGRGAFGVVYLARQLSLDREVALKVAANQGSEGRTMARLEHQHIVQVFSESVSEDGKQRRLCMQLVPGTSLQKVIKDLHREVDDASKWTGADILAIIDRAANLPAVLDPSALHDREALSRMDEVEATAWIGGRLAEALDFAHHQGVLHRDIKPANILVNRYGQPMLADFNISQRCDGAHSQFGGTLAYMAPEHVEAFNPQVSVSEEAVTERSDIYSLGIVLHELLAGRSPFPFAKLPADMLERLREITQQRRTMHPSCKQGPADARKVLEQTIAQCLEPEAHDRFASGAELAEALDGCRRLRQAERELPAPRAITRAALARPFFWLILFSLLPHLAGSAVNISYNNEQIIKKLSDAQEELFWKVVTGYNVLVYPLVIAIFWSVLRPIWRTWNEVCGCQPLETKRVDEARRGAIQLPLWAVGLAALGWLPGSVLFPLALDLFSGLNDPLRVYLHFIVSFTFSGLIAMAYSYCCVHYICLRVLYPRLWRNAAQFLERTRDELKWMPIRHALIPRLTVSIPILAVFLFLALLDHQVGWAYFMMVFGLLWLSIFGNEVARGATSRMSQTLVALTGSKQ